MEEDDLPRVERIRSAAPVPYLEAFDMMSRFLNTEKAKQVSHDFVGDAFLASATQIWDDLRLACNSIRDENGLEREAVAPWKDENGISSLPLTSNGQIESPGRTVMSSDSSSKKDKSAKKSAKKEKKEAKKAKKAAKKAKKAAKKEAKKAKKDAKKRKSDAKL